MSAVTIAVILVSFAPLALSIRCYQCTSANNSMCLDPTEYDAETLQHFMPLEDCRHGVQAFAPETNYHFFCRKITQTVLKKHYEPDVRVTRGCGWHPQKRDCYKADNEDHQETVCQCSTDGCNAAPGAPALGGVVLAAICLLTLCSFK